MLMMIAFWLKMFNSCTLNIIFDTLRFIYPILLSVCHVYFVLLFLFGCLLLCSVQSLNCVRLFATPWIAARQASLSITNSRSSLRLVSIELVMPSSHLILCCPLLLLPAIPSRIRVFWVNSWHQVAKVLEF